MNQNRPVFLDLLRIRQPLPAVVSFLHRLSGAVLFLILPFMLYAFRSSVVDAESYAALNSHGGWKLVLFFVLAGFAYHLLAGVRFLLLDLHLGTQLKIARASAWIVVGAAIFCALILGIWLW